MNYTPSPPKGRKVMAAPMGSPVPTRVAVVRNKVVDFHERMNRVAAFLKEKGADADLQMDPTHMLLQFYIDQDGLKNLNTIAGETGFSKFGVYLGLEDVTTQEPQDPGSAGFGRITACFVGLDADEKILRFHFPDPATGAAARLDPEDTWPPKPPPPPTPTSTLLALSSDPTVVQLFFT